MDLPLRMPDPLPSHGRVRLRPFRGSDAEMLVELSRDPYVPLTGTLPGDTDTAGALAYVERQHDRLVTGAGWSFCVVTGPGRNDDAADPGEPVGQASLWLRGIEQGRATAGYAVSPRHRGHGLAAQALRALTEFAWTVPEVQRVELYVEPWNVASQRVARAAGYVEEGLLRSHQVIGNQRVDMLLYAALRPNGPVEAKDPAPISLRPNVSRVDADSTVATRSALPDVLELERELQAPEVRADDQRLRELLAPDFLEIGASGRVWDLAATLDLLAGESGEAGEAAEDPPPIELHDLRGRVLAPGVVQVFWDSRRGGRAARRTSIWCLREGRWQEVYHQGTPV